MTQTQYTFKNNEVHMFIENKKFYSVNPNRVEKDEKIFMFKTQGVKVDQYPIAYYNNVSLAGLDSRLYILQLHHEMWEYFEDPMPLKILRELLQPFIEQIEIMLSVYYPNCELLQFTEPCLLQLQQQSDYQLLDLISTKLCNLTRSSAVAAVGHRIRGQNFAHYAMLARFNKVIIVCHSFDTKSIENARRKSLVQLYKKVQRFTSPI